MTETGQVMLIKTCRNKDADNIGFEYGDVQFVFSDGNILAIKNGIIVEKKSSVRFCT